MAEEIMDLPDIPFIGGGQSRLGYSHTALKGGE